MEESVSSSEQRSSPTATILTNKRVTFSTKTQECVFTATEDEEEDDDVNRDLNRKEEECDLQDESERYEQTLLWIRKHSEKAFENGKIYHHEA
ncbi:unnamed protein product [Dimorphilus gyrociliatus]|nr:unnamed protein product [Dimorphilus gyrociliatus]